MRFGNSDAMSVIRGVSGLQLPTSSFSESFLVTDTVADAMRGKALGVAKEESRGNKRGGFVRGRFWRMCPRSGFWGPGISKIIFLLPG